MRACMVTLKSISEGLTLSEDKVLDLRLTDGGRDVGLVDASICCSRGYRPRVDCLQAHAASSLARKRSTRRRPLTSTHTQ